MYNGFSVLIIQNLYGGPFHFAIATFEAILEGLISVSCLMVMVSFILASRTGLMCVSLLLCGRTNHVG